MLHTPQGHVLVDQFLATLHIFAGRLNGYSKQPGTTATASANVTTWQMADHCLGGGIVEFVEECP